MLAVDLIAVPARRLVKLRRYGMAAKARRCGGIRTGASWPFWWRRCAGWRLRRLTMRWSYLTC
jgi:hypothetical protein